MTKYVCVLHSSAKRNVCVFLRYVIVECEDQDTQQRDPKTHEMYLNVMRRFSQALLKVRPWGLNTVLKKHLEKKLFIGSSITDYIVMSLTHFLSPAG